MENMPEFNSDRREFFRVTDRVFIDFTILNDDEAERLVPVIKNPIHTNDTENKQRLNSLQTNLTHLIDQINQTDRDIARALRLLDEKITLVAQSIKQSESKFDDKKVIDANLSGGGMAFLSAEQYPSKTTIEIHIEFQSSGSTIHAIANVIACNKVYDAPKETPYLLRLVFSHMSEIDRNLLVKHTLSRQALELRINKENIS